MPEKLYDHNHIMTVSLSISKKTKIWEIIGNPQNLPPFLLGPQQKLSLFSYNG